LICKLLKDLNADLRMNRIYVNYILTNYNRKEADIFFYLVKRIKLIKGMKGCPKFM